MRNEKGYVIVVVAVLLVVLLGFLSLGLDIGLLNSSRSGAQRAADAGAMAGAFTFVTSPTAPQPQTAFDHAMGTTLSNSALATPIQEDEVSIEVDVPNRRVIVDILRSEGTFFARALGIGEADVAVRGVAEASDVATATRCGKPWFIPNTVLSELPPCGDGGACATGELLIQNGEMTPFAEARIGQQIRIRSQRPENALQPGQFYSIRLGDSQGGADYRANIATCSPQVVTCLELYGVEPGNMVGPTVQGVRDLIGDPPRDSFIAAGQYQTPNGVSNTSDALIVAPIWDTCAIPDFCPDASFDDSGANIRIPVAGFLMVFLEGVQGNDVLARVIGISACGEGSGSLDASETGPFGVPLRLVRLP